MGPLSAAQLQSWAMLRGADTSALPFEFLILMRLWRFPRLVKRSLIHKRVGHV